MERLLRPDIFNQDPSSSAAAREWAHWRVRFEKFAAVIKDLTYDNKLALLINHVSADVYTYFCDHDNYQDSIAALENVFNNRAPKKIIHLAKDLEKDQSQDAMTNELQSESHDNNTTSRSLSVNQPSLTTTPSRIPPETLPRRSSRILYSKNLSKASNSLRCLYSRLPNRPFNELTPTTPSDASSRNLYQSPSNNNSRSRSKSSSQSCSRSHSRSPSIITLPSPSKSLQESLSRLPSSSRSKNRSRSCSTPRDLFQCEYQLETTRISTSRSSSCSRLSNTVTDSLSRPLQIDKHAFCANVFAQNLEGILPMPKTILRYSRNSRSSEDDTLVPLLIKARSRRAGFECVVIDDDSDIDDSDIDDDIVIDDIYLSAEE